MKIIISIMFLISTTLQAKEFTFFPKAKKNYAAVVVKSLPSFQTITKAQAARYVPVAQNIALDLNMDAKLIISVIWTESHFKSSATSKVGAKGLMQIMPKTRKALINEMPNFNLLVSKYLATGLSYPEVEDLILGSFYLKKLTKRFNSTELAIIAYNMGPTWVSKKVATNFPLGQKNDYLNKVKTKMNIIASAE